MSEERIVVTGFGPFVGHELVNASWEAVRLLPDKIEHAGTSYTIDKTLVPVVYEDVDRIVNEIWAKNPTLVIHCGVHGTADRIHLEKLAYNNKFCRPDYAGKTLSCSSACLENNKDNKNKLHTKLNVDAIVESVNGSTSSTTACACSNDVGNYLCGYIYLRSLDANCERCLFIHVPPINKPFSSEETSHIILKAIEECLTQVNRNEN